MIALALALAASIPSATPSQVIRLYYAAINRRQYGTAYRYWSDHGRASGKSLSAFAAGFARTRSASVFIGRVDRPEGAAGSLYVTVPVRVEARLSNGNAQRFAGSYTLRRINDVPGATREQLEWHIASAKLRPVL
ncbi:MAG: hypothetical protein JSS55_17005 [Proteobacteria bacterium]|nr:hypothetical protein [Pseudomonadota bacterium]